MKNTTCISLLLLNFLCCVSFAWVPPTTTTTTTTTATIPSGFPTQHVPFLGTVYRLGGNAEDYDESRKNRSFVDHMGVPTFVTCHAPSIMNETTIQSPIIVTPLDVVQPGPALFIEHVLPQSVCRDMVAACEDVGFQEFHAGKNHHGALQLIVSPTLVDSIARRLAPRIDVSAVEEALISSSSSSSSSTKQAQRKLRMVGLNRRWRVYRYAPGGIQSFAPHIDAGFPPSGLTDDGTDLVWDISAPSSSSSSSSSIREDAEPTIVSRLTLLLYLNDDFHGGETIFYPPIYTRNDDDDDDIENDNNTNDGPLVAVKPVTGAALLFPQAVGEAAVAYARHYWPLHEGSPVRVGSAQPKYVIRSDVLFEDDAGIM